MPTFTLYLISVIDKLTAFLSIIGVSITCIGLFFVLYNYLETPYTKVEINFKQPLIALAVGLFIIFTTVFIPSADFMSKLKEDTCTTETQLWGNAG